MAAISGNINIYLRNKRIDYVSYFRKKTSDMYFNISVVTEYENIPEMSDLCCVRVAYNSKRGVLRLMRERSQVCPFSVGRPYNSLDGLISNSATISWKIGEC